MRERPFGPYRLVHQIAVGGMAEIYLARARGLAGFEKYVALKMIHPNFSQDEAFIEMLIDEAKLTVQLQHVNIVQTFDLGKVDHTYYITMEFVDGADLYQLLRRGSERGIDVPIPVAAHIAKEIATGLDYAHRKRDRDGNHLGIVHRDVSPQNVLISHSGEVKLVDFGIAKASMRAKETQVGVIKGKYYYMSPEQAWGDRVDLRTDIFSTGIVLHEMLVGQMLYYEEDLHRLLERVRKAEVLPPSAMRQEVPPELERIAMRALNKRSEDRFQSAGEMANELERFLNSYSRAFSADAVRSWVRSVLGNAQTSKPSPTAASISEEEVAHRAGEFLDENSVIFDPSAWREREGLETGIGTSPPGSRQPDELTAPSTDFQAPVVTPAVAQAARTPAPRPAPGPAAVTKAPAPVAAAREPGEDTKLISASVSEEADEQTQITSMPFLPPGDFPDDDDDDDDVNGADGLDDPTSIVPAAALAAAVGEQRHADKGGNGARTGDPRSTHKESGLSKGPTPTSPRAAQDATAVAPAQRTSPGQSARSSAPRAASPSPAAIAGGAGGAAGAFKRSVPDIPVIRPPRVVPTLSPIGGGDDEQLAKTDVAPPRHSAPTPAPSAAPGPTETPSPPASSAPTTRPGVRAGASEDGETVEIARPRPVVPAGARTTPAAAPAPQGARTTTRPGAAPPRGLTPPPDRALAAVKAPRNPTPTADRAPAALKSPRLGSQPATSPFSFTPRGSLASEPMSPPPPRNPTPALDRMPAAVAPPPAVADTGPQVLTSAPPPDRATAADPQILHDSSRPPSAPPDYAQPQSTGSSSPAMTADFPAAFPASPTSSPELPQLFAPPRAPTPSPSPHELTPNPMTDMAGHTPAPGNGNGGDPWSMFGNMTAAGSQPGPPPALGAPLGPSSLGLSPAGTSSNYLPGAPTYGRSPFPPDYVKPEYNLRATSRRKWLILVALLAVGGIAAVVFVGVGREQETAAPTAKLEILSTPTGAHIEVNDVELPDPTPALYENARPGETYEVKLSLPGYEPAVRQVPVPTAGGRHQVVVTLEKIKVSLRIETEPPGASVYLNGNPRGVTPLTIEDLDPEDATTIEVRKKGYRPAWTEPEWKPGERTKVVPITLERGKK